MQYRKSFRAKLTAEHVEAGDVSSRTIEACDKTHWHRIGTDAEQDRNGGRHRLRRESWEKARSDDHSDPKLG